MVIAAANTTKSSILIVDDTPANVAVLAEHLDSHGFGVMVAEEGEEAITRARLTRPDMILLDVMMPGLSGFDTCKQLKADPLTRDIPVIFMTALSNIADKMAGYEAGAVDFITKPFHTDEVLARVNTHLSLQKMRSRLLAQNSLLQQEIAVRKEAESVLAERSGELARSNAQLEQMAYVASHHLQQPLGMVGGYLQSLAQRHVGRLDADAVQLVDLAVEGVGKMQSVVDVLLTYSQLGTKGDPFKMTDCAAVMETVQAALRPALEGSGAQIECVALPVVLGDAAQLALLLQNLLANALKFRATQAPRIILRASAAGRFWRFELEDNGIGIAKDRAPRIFDMFQRLHSQDTQPATGMGLAICKKIVERHGGRIWVEPAPLQGSVFVFTLPRIVDAGAIAAE